MSELINHVLQIPAPMAVVLIAILAFAAQLDFRASRHERRPERPRKDKVSAAASPVVEPVVKETREPTS